jgi:hypothetical protein
MVKSAVFMAFLLLVGLLVGRPGLDPGTLGLKEKGYPSDYHCNPMIRELAGRKLG